MKKETKMLLWFLQMFCIAALGVWSITAAEVEEEYGKYYSRENCPDIVLETVGEEGKKWLENQYLEGKVERLETFPFYYEKNSGRKIYCVKKEYEEKNQGRLEWKAAFTGYRRLTVKQEFWQPVEEIFHSQEEYGQGGSESQSGIRIHIWCRQPENLMDVIENQNWELKEKYLSRELFFYRHKQEVKEITVKVLRILGSLACAAAGIGYLAGLFLKTIEREKEREIYKKLGASRKQYGREVLVRLAKSALISWAGGTVLFFFLHFVLMKTFASCFSLPYRFSKETQMEMIFNAGIALCLIFPLAYGTVMAASRADGKVWRQGIRKGICLFSAGISAAVFLTSVLIRAGYGVMEHELEERKKYDAVVFFDSFLKDEKAEEILRLAGAKAVEPADFIQVTLKGEREIQVTAIGIRSPSTLLQVKDEKNVKQMPEEDGVLLSEYTAVKAGVKKGDKIGFEAVYNGKEFSGNAKVQKLICQQTQFQEVFRAEGFAYANGAFVLLGNKDLDSSFLYETEHVEGVLYREEEEAEYRQRTGSVKRISDVLGAASLLIFLAALSLLGRYTRAVLIEELSVLYALGCPQKQRKRITQKKFTAAFFPGIAAGILGGMILGGTVLKLLCTDNFLFVFSGRGYCLGTGVVIAAAIRIAVACGKYRGGHDFPNEERLSHKEQKNL